MNNQTVEKIYESRRIKLKALADQLGRGAIASIAKTISIEPNYLSRCLYPPGKAGRKNIGEETFTKLKSAYPKFFSEEPPPPAPAVTDAYKAEQIPVIYRPIEKLAALPETLLDKLMNIASRISDDGLRLLIAYAEGVEAGHPREAKPNQARSST